MRLQNRRLTTVNLQQCRQGCASRFQWQHTALSPLHKFYERQLQHPTDSAKGTSNDMIYCRNQLPTSTKLHTHKVFSKWLSSNLTLHHILSSTLMHTTHKKENVSRLKILTMPVTIMNAISALVPSSQTTEFLF